MTVRDGSLLDQTRPSERVLAETVSGRTALAETASAGTALTDPPVTWKWVGDLDAGDAADLRDTWQSLVRGRPSQIVVDMAAVTFIDCAVVAVLVLARRELGSRLVLLSVPRQATRLFALTQLTDVLLPGEHKPPGGPRED